jgi:hypothetical protein
VRPYGHGHDEFERAKLFNSEPASLPCQHELRLLCVGNPVEQPGGWSAQFDWLRLHRTGRRRGGGLLD